MPENGPGSAATLGRRIGAIFIDWIACAIVAQLIFPQFSYGSQGSAMATLGVFFVVVSIFTVLGGASFGQRIVGIRVAALAYTSIPCSRCCGRCSSASWCRL